MLEHLWTRSRPAPEIDRHTVDARGTHECGDEHRRSVQLPLASADEGLHFTADLELRFRPDDTEAQLVELIDLAELDVLQRAEGISRLHRLNACERVRLEVNAELLRWELVGDARVRVRGRCTAMTADPDLVAAVAEDEKLEHQRLISSWRARRQHQREREMASMLLDPLRATASWLLQHEGTPDEALAAAQRYSEVREVLSPAEQVDTPGLLVDELLTEADQPIRKHARDWLATWLRRYGSDQLAERLGTSEE